MTRTGATLLGGLLLAALPATFGVALATHQTGPPLYVDLAAPLAHAVLATPSAPLPPMASGPRSLGRRLKSEDWLSSLATGTWFRTYSAAWGGGRWIEEVTVPALVGPFHRQDEFVCGFQTGVSAKVLDTKATARPLKAVLTALVRALPKIDQTVASHGVTGNFHFRFPEVRDVDLTFAFHRGFIEPSVRITLIDNSFIAGSVQLTLASDDGRPVVREKGPATVSWGGRAFAQLTAEAEAFGAQLAEKAFLEGDIYQVSKVIEEKEGPWKAAAYRCRRGALCKGILGGLLRGALTSTVDREGIPAARSVGRAEALALVAQLVPARIQAEVTAKFRAAISALNGGLEHLTEPWCPFGTADRTMISFQLGGQPIIDESGIRASICMRWSWASPPPSFGADVPGPAALPTEAGSGITLPPDRPLLHVQASSDALNQLLWGLWRSGKIREQGQLSSILALFDEDARRKIDEKLQLLLFDVTGVDPQLPPTVASIHGAGGGAPDLLLSVADADVGQLKGRRVVAHAQGSVSMAQRGDEIQLGLKMQRISGNCAERLGDGTTRLDPCFSDLLPALRGEMSAVDITKTLRGTEILGHIRLLAFQGVCMTLTKLEARSIAPGPMLDISVVPSFAVLPEAAANQPGAKCP